MSRTKPSTLPRAANQDLSTHGYPRIRGSTGSAARRESGLDYPDRAPSGLYRRQETMLRTHVSTPSGQKRLVTVGSRLVFGRGPEVDLIIAAGRGLSRRAGVVTMLAAGAWIANISRTHALYVEGDGYQVRLPRMEDDGEPASGWFVHAGTAMVGSRAMLDEGQSLVVTVSGQHAPTAVLRGGGWADAAGLADDVEWTDEVHPALGAVPGEAEEAAAGL